MYVMRLLHDAVFMKAGSYDTSPGPSGVTRICWRSVARIAPFSIGTSKRRPLRLSMTVRLSFAILPPGGGSSRPAGLGPAQRRIRVRAFQVKTAGGHGLQFGYGLLRVAPHAAPRGVSPARRGPPLGARRSRPARRARSRTGLEAPQRAVPGDARRP